MDLPFYRSYLAGAERLLQEARAITKRQRARVTQLRADGALTQLYERGLRDFESNLLGLEQQVRLLRSHFGE